MTAGTADRPLRILVSSINFHPDHSGIALYATDLPLFLAERGHRVSMVSGFPYYPAWRKRPEDRGALFRRERHGDVDLLRGYLYVPRRATTLRRILHDLSFVGFAAANFLRAGRHDLIIVLTPPLLLGLVGVVFRRLWRSKLVVHIQDLQLDAARSLGMFTTGALIRPLARIERHVYRRADLVVPISDGMRARLRAKGVSDEKTRVVYNWIDVEASARRGREGALVERMPQLAGKFVVAYAGNIGVKQGVDVLIDLAEAMRDRPDFHFLIVGEGADRERLVQRAARQRLENLTFHPFLATEAYFDLLRGVQLCFVGQRAGTGDVFFPSKLLGVMAQARPLLVSADLDSELARFVSGSGCGVVAAAQDVDTLKRHLLDCRRGPERLARMGRAGRAAVQRFDRETVLSDYLDRILEAARG